MAERFWMYVKHNVKWPNKGKYRVYDTGFESDSITEIRKVAMDQATYDYYHQIHDGAHKIVDSRTGKVLEEVWMGRDGNYYMEKPYGVMYKVDEKTGRVSVYRK